MTAFLFASLWILAAAGMLGAYVFGFTAGRAYVSDRTFGPVAAGLVRIEGTSESLAALADEPLPYWPAELLDDAGRLPCTHRDCRRA